MWWPAVATLAAAGAVAAYSSTTWRWGRVGPFNDPTPFGPLDANVTATTLGTVLAIVPGALAVGGLVDSGWAWVPWLVVLVALIAPLVNVSSVTFEVYLTELAVGRGTGALSGHADAHVAASPVEGRLLRAASVAPQQLKAPLVELAEVVRLAERAAARTAAKRLELQGTAFEHADRLDRLLSAVQPRPNRRLSDPVHMPTRWPRWLQATWAPVARRIDAFRAIHNHQADWIALYGLLWWRPGLLLGAAVLSEGGTWGLRPLVGTGAAGDIAWAAALLVAIISAVAAPWLVPIIQSRSIEEISLCRRLMWLEVPTWMFLVLTAPSWLAWTYGAVTFIYAGRLGWSTGNAVVIGFGGIGGLIASLALRDASVWQATCETFLAVAALTVSSTLYAGPMWPVVVDRLMFADARIRRAERRLERAIARAAVAETRQAAISAARLIDQHGMNGTEADAIRAVAVAVDQPSRWRWSSRIQTLAEIAADAAAPVAPATGPDARLTVQWEPALGLADRAVRRTDRRALRRVLKAMIGEADRHALGTVVVTIAEEGGFLHLRVANQPDPNSPPGGGEGTRIVNSELGSLPDGRHAHPPGLRQIRRRGVLRDFWVVEVVCSSQVLV